MSKVTHCRCLTSHLGRGKTGINRTPLRPTLILPASILHSYPLAKRFDLDDPHASRPNEHQVKIISSFGELKPAIDDSALIKEVTERIEHLRFPFASCSIGAYVANLATNEPCQPDPCDHCTDDRYPCEKRRWCTEPGQARSDGCTFI